MNLLNRFLLVLLIIPAGLLIQSCDDNSTGPDFSAAPEPYDRTAAVRDSSLGEGLEIFVIQDGEGPYEVTPNDQIQVRYTGRTADGEIFDTTYRPSSTTDNSRILSNLTPGPKSNQSPLIEGFRKGLVGMEEGEKRIIEIPPSLGYSDSTPGTNGFNLRNDTLIFDVELIRIF